MKTSLRHGIRLPHKRLYRILLGIALILGGIIGFLPVLGFWMIPLGLVVLSVDIARVRRWRRRLLVWVHRRWRNRRNANPQ
jgi:hypothetical protein